MDRKECYRSTHPLSTISGYATDLVGCLLCGLRGVEGKGGEDGREEQGKGITEGRGPTSKARGREG